MDTKDKSKSFKTSISLPSDLHSNLKRLASKEQKSISGLIQEATKTYLQIKQLEELQAHFSVEALKAGIRTEEDLDDLIHS